VTSLTPLASWDAAGNVTGLATRPPEPLASAVCLTFPENCIHVSFTGVMLLFPPNTFVGVSFVAFFVLLRNVRCY
jgi:hypothetical protein